MAPVKPINPTYAPLQALADELVRCGMRHAVTSPGSRNAPLALTLAAAEGLEAVSVIDERSAGFVALGMAKASGRPVAVTCTSGSAAANLLPAVVEAHEGRVPLIVLTADRPPELRDTGAGQAIDQIKLYGSAAKWFVEVGNHEPGRASAVFHRALGCRAYFTAAGGRPGPVHLNFPLREPLAPVVQELPAEPWAGRPEGRPWVEVHEPAAQPEPSVVEELVERLRNAGRGVVVCGSTAESVAAPAARLARALAWPLLAEPTSGVRCGPHDRSHVVAHYDALLRSESFAQAHRAALVLRIGDTPTSKPLRSWLERAAQVLIDPVRTWHEPTRAAETVVTATAAATCTALAAAFEKGPPVADDAWLRSWRAADALVAPALDAVGRALEPGLYAALPELLPDGATVWVSSSMPIRDLESFLPQTGKRLRFLANRGANGIDGVVSSALGAAVASAARVVLITGELALVHDAGGLLAAGRRQADLTVICLNNDGGGIFDFLPVGRHADSHAYREHVLTPSGVDLSALAAAAGMAHRRVEDLGELGSNLERPGVVEIPTDRAANLRVHRELFEGIAAAL